MKIFDKHGHKRDSKSQAIREQLHEEGIGEFDPEEDALLAEASGDDYDYDWDIDPFADWPEAVYSFAKCGHVLCEGMDMPPGNLWCNTHNKERDCPRDASCPECRRDQEMRYQ
jgi:hypothetical protein